MNTSSAETEDSKWEGIYIIGGGAALLVGIIFLTAIIDIVLTGLQPVTRNGWLSSFQNNWLIVIFKLHAGLNKGQLDLLYGWNLLDFAILALVGTTYTGLYAVLRRTNKTWSMIALALPFLGFVLFIVTKMAGRSGVMGAGLVISVVMLRSKLFNKPFGYIGILSGVLLLAGDLSVGMAPSNVFAFLTGIGYLLLMTWYFLVARRLFQLGHLQKKMLPQPLQSEAFGWPGHRM